MVASDEAPVLAVDVGGTKIAAGVVDRTGQVAGAVEVPTPAADAEGLFATLQTAITRSLTAAGVEPTAITAIGVGCGGPMQFPAGVVSPLNIPGWRDFPLRTRLAQAYGCRVVVDAYHVFWDPDLDALLTAATGLIAGFHVSDWLVPTTDLLAGRGLMGDGIIDLPRIHALVEATGYDGPVEVEVINPALAEADDLLADIKARFARI